MRDLLVFQGSFLHLSTAGSVEAKKRKWREYSEAIAVRLEKRPKYAQFLRRWETDWVENRTPCPMKGRNVKSTSLFNDEVVRT